MRLHLGLGMALLASLASLRPERGEAEVRDAAFSGMPVATPQYADTADHQDVIMDAPWYVAPTRVEIPFLIFCPDIYWKQSREYGVRFDHFMVVNPRDADWTIPTENWFVRQSVLYRDTSAPPNTNRREVKNLVTRIKDENGGTLAGLALSEGVVPTAPVQTPGWHRILQVPVNLLKPNGPYIYLAGYASASRIQMKDGQVVKIEDRVEWRKMMRVQVGKLGLPALDKDRDHQFDPHFHTMSEYSLESGAWAPKQAFAGPWQMAVDCAFAVGLTESADRANIPNKIISTDHCWEYVDTYFPEVGPFQDLVKAGVDRRAPEVAGQLEYELMRSYFGSETGAQEAHMRRKEFVKFLSLPPKEVLVAAAHTLVYGHPDRVIAPWHGMGDNAQTIDTIQSMLAKGGGFTFGAHPYNGPPDAALSMSWSDEYFQKGIQFAPYNDRDRTRDGEFVVKGFQIWNERVTYANASGFPAARFAAMNPFAGTIDTSRIWAEGRLFTVYPPWSADLSWHEELSKGLIGVHRFITEGLGYAFKDEPARRFFRKLFWLGATDAHGDFNYGSGHTATTLDNPALELFNTRSVTSNAFARVRTYVFGKTIDAMKKGQCLMTDGPLAEVTLDTDLRFETPPPGETGEHRWHDRWYGVDRIPRERAAEPRRGRPAQWKVLRTKGAPLPLEDRWFTADGRVGGDGAFDGTRTLLTVADNPYTVLRYRWTNNDEFGGAVNRIEMTKDVAGRPDPRQRVERGTEVRIPERDATLPAYDDREWSYLTFWDIDGGRLDRIIPGVSQPAAAPQVTANAAFSLAAFTARSEARRYHPDEFRCFTNPIWASPVGIEIRVANEPTAPEDRYTGAAVGGGAPKEESWEPPQVVVDFAFGLTMDGRRQPAVWVRQLNAEGESEGTPQRLQPGRWVGVPGRLEDYWYQNATASLDVQTGAHWWYNTRTRDGDFGYVSFVVYMEDPVDFHGNRLNAIAKAFTTTLRKRDGQQKSTAYSYPIDLAPGQKKTVSIPTYCVDPHTPCFTLRGDDPGRVGARRDAVPLLLIPPGGGRAIELRPPGQAGGASEKPRGGAAASEKISAAGAPLGVWLPAAADPRERQLDAARRDAAAGKPIDVALALEAGLVEAEARPVGQWLAEPAVIANRAPHPLRVVIPVGTVLTPTRTPRRPEFLLDTRGKPEAIEVALAAEDLARKGRLDLPRGSPLRRALPHERARQIVTQWATWYVVNRETPEAMREALERAFPEDFAKLKEDPEALSAAARDLWAIVERILARRSELAKAAAEGKFKWTSIDPYAAVTLGARGGDGAPEAVETR